MDIKIGMIGCGNIARAHLRGYQENGAEIVAFTDINHDLAAEFSAKIKNSSCFDNFRKLIDSGTVNAVSICSPPVAHEEAAVYALKHKVHVLCEKPLAHDVESAKRIVAAADRSGALLMTAFRHRFLPAIEKMRGLINDGTIGQPVFFHNIFCGPAPGMRNKWFSKKEIAGGGCLVDTSSHSVDIFRFLIGEIVEQSAVTHGHWAETGVEDAGILTLKSENGCLGSLISAWVAGVGAAHVSVMGEKGVLLYDYTKPAELKLQVTGNPEPNIIPVQKSDGFKEEIRHFLEAVKGKQKLSCTGIDGLRALEVIHSTYRRSV